MTDAMLPLNEFASYLRELTGRKFTGSHVYRLIWDGRFPSAHKVDGRWVIASEDATAYVSTRRDRGGTR